MTAEKFLNLARAEIGVTESPRGSNKVKYGDAYGGSPVPWCVQFQWWLFREAGESHQFYGGKKTSYAPTLLSFHQKAGQVVDGDYKPGDIVFFDFNGNKQPDHVGVCEAWDGTYMTSIDGNTGEGNEANGGAVMRRKRHKRYVLKAYRPKWDGVSDTSAPSVVKPTCNVKLPVLQKGHDGDSVRAMQQLLNLKGFDAGAIDGVFGTKTDTALRNFQEASGLTRDGKCGPATWGTLIGL